MIFTGEFYTWNIGNTATVLNSTEQKIEEMELSLTGNTFPLKLWRMAHDVNITSIVWSDQGDQIVINMNGIEKDFSSFNACKGCSSASFVRRLYMYGFKKSKRLYSENLHYFVHPHFRRSRPELLPLLKNCVKKPRVKVHHNNDLTERWRDHRNLGDTEDGAEAEHHANLENGETFCADFRKV